MFIPLENGEEILLKVHRHWVFIWMRIFGFACIATLPVAVYAVLAHLKILTIVASRPAICALGALWTLVLWGFFWKFWTTYYMDIWVVTNRRIIDIDYHRLFDRNISILRLNRVQDITTHVQGIFGTILRYGSVVVQTAGSDKQFVIDQIAHPEILRDVISRFTGAAI